MQCNMLPFKSALGCTMVVHLDGWPGHSEIRPAGAGEGRLFPRSGAAFTPKRPICAQSLVAVGSGELGARG